MASEWRRQPNEGEMNHDVCVPSTESVEAMFDLDWDDESDTAVWTPTSEVLRAIQRAQYEPEVLQS